MFYSISTIIGYLMANPLYIYILNIIRLFNVISRTLIEGVLTLYRNALGVVCSPSQLGQLHPLNDDCQELFCNVCERIFLCRTRMKSQLHIHERKP